MQFFKEELYCLNQFRLTLSLGHCHLMKHRQCELGHIPTMKEVDHYVYFYLATVIPQTYLMDMCVCVSF